MDPELRAILERFDRRFDLLAEGIVAVREDVEAVRGDVAGFRTLSTRVELFERRVDGRLETVENRLSGIESDGRGMLMRMKAVEIGLVDLHGRVDTVADDMRQRFRLR